MSSARPFLTSLEKVASLPSTTPVSSSFFTVLSLTLHAFNSAKPLFPSSDKSRAFSALHRCLPLLRKAFIQLDVGMTVDRRIDAQKYRSGLQFIVDEVSERDDLNLHKEFLDFISSVPIISIEKFIENTTGCTPDTIVSEKVDVSKIPRSHYWWFYEECHDE